MILFFFSMVDQLYESSVLTRCHDSVLAVNQQVSGKEPSAVFSQNNLSVPMNEDSRPCESSNCRLKNGLIKPINAESSNSGNSGKCLSESKELVPLPTNPNSGRDVTYVERNCNQASTYAKSDAAELPSTSGNGNGMLGVIMEPESPNNYCSQTYPLGYPSSIVQESIDLSTSAASSTVDATTEVLVIHSSDSNPISAISDSSPTPHLVREPTMESGSSDGASFTSTGPGNERDENVIHVDVVSISSNIVTSSTAEASDNEARRNSRRLFWDAFSRRSSRRNNDSLMIFSSADDTDDLESHSRWLLDISDDIFENGTEDEFSYLRRRRLGASGRRWHSRSEVIFYPIFFLQVVHRMLISSCYGKLQTWKPRGFFYSFRELNGLYARLVSCLTYSYVCGLVLGKQMLNLYDIALLVFMCITRNKLPFQAAASFLFPFYFFLTFKVDSCR